MAREDSNRGSVDAVSNDDRVASSTSAVTLLAANGARQGVIIVNDSTAILYVKFGADASSTDYTYKLAAGETLELPATRAPLYTGLISGAWASANGAAQVSELAA